MRLRAAGGNVREVHARSLVNACGPWAATFLADIARLPQQRALRLVKGSHIVVRKLYEHSYAYTFQQADRRIVFAIPFEHDFTLIGTTDVEFGGDPGVVRIDADETMYLCNAINNYFARPITPADVLWSYSGVRPLLEEEGRAATEVTRDYVLDFDDARRAAGQRVRRQDHHTPQACRRSARLACAGAGQRSDCVDRGRAAAAGRRSGQPAAGRQHQLRPLSAQRRTALSVAAGRTRAALCTHLWHAHPRVAGACGAT